MPTYAILRMERHPTLVQTPNGPEATAIVIKPMPLVVIDNEPLSVEAESAELALAFAIRRYPHFRHLLATQELSAYVEQHSPNTGRVLRDAKTRRANP